MYFNYITNSFSPSPKEKTREETVTEIGKDVAKTVTVEILVPDDCIEVDDDVCEAMFNEVNTSATPKAIFANKETHYPEVRELESQIGE